MAAVGEGWTEETREVFTLFHQAWAQIRDRKLADWAEVVWPRWRLRLMGDDHCRASQDQIRRTVNELIARASGLDPKALGNLKALLDEDPRGVQFLAASAAVSMPAHPSEH